jgi:fatty-acyl-CoA synthase
MRKNEASRDGHPRKDRAPADVADPVTLEAISADTLLACFDERAKRRRRIAFRLESVSARPIAVSWERLADSVTEAARRMRGMGVRPGDRVLLVLPTSADFVVFFWGILRAGATPVPAYPPAGWKQLAGFAGTAARMTGITGARLMIVPEPLRDVLKGAAELRGCGVAGPEDIWAAKAAPALPRPPAPDDLALIQFSSGSTGEPRGICLTQANLLSNIRGFARRMELKRDDVLVSWLPLYHDMGLIGTMIAPLAIGMPLVLLPPTDFLRRPDFWLRVMSKYGATISVAPQFAYSLCLRRVEPDSVAGLDLSPLRILLNGAEPIQAADLAAFEKHFRPLGLRRGVVTPCYGLAESTLAVCMQPPGRTLSKKEPVSTAAPAGNGAAGGVRRPVVSVGPPLAGVEVHIRAHGGHWSGDSEVGEIWVRGPSVCRGYLTAQGRVEATDSHGWLHTGDLGFLRGGELYVTGRQKDLIIIGGRNLYPQEIEAAIGELPGMRAGRIAAFGLEEEARGTEGLIVVAETTEPTLGDPATAAGALRQEVFRRFGIAPHDIMLVGRGQIPLTTSGKLRRFEARSVYQQDAYSNVIYRLGAPRPAADC